MCHNLFITFHELRPIWMETIEWGVVSIFVVDPFSFLTYFPITKQTSKEKVPMVSTTFLVFLNFPFPKQAFRGKIRKYEAIKGKICE